LKLAARNLSGKIKEYNTWWKVAIWRQPEESFTPDKHAKPGWFFFCIPCAFCGKEDFLSGGLKKPPPACPGGGLPKEEDFFPSTRRNTMIRPFIFWTNAECHMTS
jgi:hypothetical protein